MPNKPVPINHAPALTRWAAVVARRIGFPNDEATPPGHLGAHVSFQQSGPT